MNFISPLMAITLAVLTLIFNSADLLANEVIKTCVTEVSMPFAGSSVPTKLEIVKRPGGKYVAVTTQTIDGFESSWEEQASVYPRQVIRSEALKYDTMVDEHDFNLSEGLVAHAAALVSDPEFGGHFSVGFDLAKIKKATVYQVGEMSNMGGTAIVEAFGEDNEPLGSFLGGFVVSPCK